MDQSIVYEIDTPDVLRIPGTHAGNRMFTVTEPLTLLMAGAWEPEDLLHTTQSLNPFATDLPAFDAK